MKKIFPLLAFAIFLFGLSCQSAQIQETKKPAKKIFLLEKFHNLKNWKVKAFPSIARHSQYSILRKKGRNCLRCTSANSASALVFKKTFSVYQHPQLSWKWKVNNLYKKGNSQTKEGDDYPLRIYVFFPYDPSQASALEKLKYETARMFYGFYPPHSSLNYIWANRNHKAKILTSPYSDRVKMIALQKGKTNLGQWKEEQVNIVADYKRAFGVNPPKKAMVAIMNDSDNTGEKSTSYLEYIQVYSNQTQGEQK